MSTIGKPSKPPAEGVSQMSLVGVVGGASPGSTLHFASFLKRAFSRASANTSREPCAIPRTSLIARRIVPVTTPPTAPSPTMKMAPSGLPPHQKKRLN